MRGTSMIILSMLIIASPALSQEIDPDFDGDGAVSMAEAREVDAMTFKELDFSGNGYVSFFEIELQLKQWGILELKSLRTLFETTDEDQDSLISKPEYIAAGARHFRLNDRNHDGFLTDDELSR